MSFYRIVVTFYTIQFIQRIQEEMSVIVVARFLKSRHLVGAQQTGIRYITKTVHRTLA